MPKAAKKKVTKPVTKVAARRTRPKPKRKPREKPMADKEKSDDKGYSTGVATASPPKTVEKEPLAGGTQGSYSATTVSVPPAEMLTEQEKDAAAGGEGAGVGPVSASETTTGPVETIEDQGIGPRTPYPTGNPPPPDAPVVAAKKGK